MIVNKGKIVGLSSEELKQDDNILGFYFLSVLFYIIESWQKQGEEKSEIEMNPKQRGLVKEAYDAMYHDMHGLAVLIDLIKLLHFNKANGTRHKDFLYVMEIVEKYFANLRSMYDFLAKILRLSVNPKYIGQLNFDSFNGLISAIEKGKTNGKIPTQLEELIISAKEDFEHVRNVRDTIIHNGEQLDAPITKDDGYYMCAKDSCGNTVERSLLCYLSELTNKFFTVADEIADIIYEEYSKRYREVPVAYVALTGVCIPSFVDFLGLTGIIRRSNT